MPSKGAPSAIGAPGRREESSGLFERSLHLLPSGEIPKLSRLKVEDPDVGPAGATRGNESELGPVRRQCALVVQRRAIGEPFQPSTRWMNAIQIGLPESVPLRSKHDPLAVVRERSDVIESRTIQ